MPSRSEYDEWERSLSETDPDVIEAQAEARDKLKRRTGLLRSQSERDARELMVIPAFRRYAFTVLSRGGIYAASRHALDGDYAYDAGRRALALELLNELLGIDPQFVIDLSVEQAKLEDSLKNDPSPQ